MRLLRLRAAYVRTRSRLRVLVRNWLGLLQRSSVKLCPTQRRARLAGNPADGPEVFESWRGSPGLRALGGAAEDFAGGWEAAGSADEARAGGWPARAEK